MNWSKGDAFVDRAHALGLKVIPWTINDTDTMRAQIAAGSDGIITDYPTLLHSVMAQIAAGSDGIITDYPTLLHSVMAQLGMPLPPQHHRG